MLIVWAQDFFHLLPRLKGLKGKLTHRVNHILKLFLVEEMVINTILLTIVGPPCGVTDSVDANKMCKYGWLFPLGEFLRDMSILKKNRPIGEVFTQILAQSVGQLSLPTALRTSQNQHWIWSVRTRKSAPRKHTHKHSKLIYIKYIGHRYVFSNSITPPDHWQSCISHFYSHCR